MTLASTPRVPVPPAIPVLNRDILPLSPVILFLRRRIDIPVRLELGLRHNPLTPYLLLPLMNTVLAQRRRDRLRRLARTMRRRPRPHIFTRYFTAAGRALLILLDFDIVGAGGAPHTGCASAGGAGGTAGSDGFGAVRAWRWRYCRRGCGWWGAAFFAVV